MKPVDELPVTVDPFAVLSQIQPSILLRLADLKRHEKSHGALASRGFEKKVSASVGRTRILNQGSGGRGQQDFGFI